MRPQAPGPAHQRPGLVVQVRRLSAGPRILLQDWSLHAPPASITTVMGPSGCGKSTLLAALAAGLSLLWFNRIL